MKRAIKRIFLFLVLMITVAAVGNFVSAADTSSDTGKVETPAEPAAPKPSKKEVWKNTKKGLYFYYDSKGKKVTGKKKIGKHYYYFDKDGRQHVGWQKIGKEYYFFKIKKGNKAYMVTNTTVNGIKINSKGVANRKSSYNKRKLALMVAANKTLESLTKNRLTYTKREKLRMCFNYTERKYYCCNLGSFRQTSTWDMDYAERVIIPKDRQYRADCYTYGCGMAYLANACGAKAAAVSSTGHGWAEVDGYVCDSNWSRVDRAHNYFMRSYNLHEAGTPPYKSSRYIVKTI